MTTKAMAMWIVAVAAFVAAPATADLLLDFENPPYSLGGLNGQDGWSGPGDATIVNTNPSPVGGQSVQDGWISWRALDQTYSTGTIYLTHYEYWNGDNVGSGSVDTPAASVILADSGSGRRAFLAGRWSDGYPGIWGASKVFTTFEGAGWYGWDLEIDIDSQLIVSGSITQMDTMQTEVLATNLGFSSDWGGGQPSQLNQVGFAAGAEGQADHIAVGYTKVPLIPEPATMALLGIGGLMVLRRRRSA